MLLVFQIQSPVIFLLRIKKINYMIFFVQHRLLFSDIVWCLFFSFTTPSHHRNNYNVIKCKFIRLHYTLHCTCNSDYITLYTMFLHYQFGRMYKCSPVVKKKKGDMNRNTPNRNIICIILCIYNPLSKNILRIHKFIYQFMKNTWTDLYIFT